MRILFHGSQEIACLIRQRLQRRADDVRTGGAAREAIDRTARIRIPPWRTQPRERRHHVHPLRIAHTHGYLTGIRHVI